MLGPFSASLASIKEYFKIHKWQLTSMILAFCWGITLSPIVHGITESYLSYQGETSFSELKGKVNSNETLNSREKLIQHSIEQEKQELEKRKKALAQLAEIK